MVVGFGSYGVKPTPETAKPMPEAPENLPADGVAVLILCSGLKCAWEGDEPKQLRVLGGETVLGRIIRQVQDLDHEPTIITWREDIREATLDLPQYAPEYRRTIAETWLYTRLLWREQTVILLGDVLYGSNTIRETLAYRGTMKMVGNPAELFAFTFASDEHDKVARVLYEADRDTLKGAPWQIHRGWCGVPYNKGHREALVFQQVWDRTCDIDTLREWEDVVRQYDEFWKDS